MTFEITADNVTIHDLSVVSNWVAFQVHDPGWDGGVDIPDNTEIYNTCVTGGGQALDGFYGGSGLKFHTNPASGDARNDLFRVGDGAQSQS